MIIHYIATDTQQQYDLEWKNAILLPYGTDNWLAILQADYVPSLKCRWCQIGHEKYSHGEMTISDFKENDILTWITAYFKEHNDTAEE